MNLTERRQDTMAKSLEGSLHKHIRIFSGQWQRVERAAEGTIHSPNQLLVDLAMEALDHRETLTGQAQIQIARSTLFTAQVLARDLIASGRENDVQEIRAFISTIVPDIGDRPSADSRDDPPTHPTRDGEW